MPLYFFYTKVQQNYRHFAKRLHQEWFLMKPFGETSNFFSIDTPTITIVQTWPKTRIKGTCLQAGPHPLIWVFGHYFSLPQILKELTLSEKKKGIKLIPKAIGNKKKKEIGHEVARGDKHYLRKFVDHKAPISKAFALLTELIFVLRYAYFWRRVVHLEQPHA